MRRLAILLGMTVAVTCFEHIEVIPEYPEVTMPAIEVVAVPEVTTFTLDGVEYNYDLSIQTLFNNGWELKYAILEAYCILVKDGCTIQVECTNPELLLTNPSDCHVTGLIADWNGEDYEMELFTSDGLYWRTNILCCNTDLNSFVKTTQGLYTYYTKTFNYNGCDIEIIYTVINQVITCVEFHEVTANEA